MPEASFPSSSGLNRRSFLTNAGVAAASLLLLTACPDPGGDDPVVEPVITLSSGDTGVLSYLYILERFSADFYTRVLANAPADLTAAELAVLRDLSRHELVHREVLTQAMTSNGLALDANLPLLEFRYESFTLTTRQGVLAAAQTIEDLTVAALCGAAKLLSTSVLLQLVMRLTAVEARHAATVRDLRQAGSFAAADVVGTTGAEAGLNQVLTPTEVLNEFNAKYSPIKLSSANLPTS